MEILKGFAEKFQQVSMDEVYLIPGPEIRNFEEAAIYALRIWMKSKTGKNYLFSGSRTE